MKKRIISMAVSFSMIFSILASPLSVKAEEVNNEGKGTAYYVSTLDGRDNNDGLSENKAFYSLQKINEIELKPGDRVLLEAGSVFTNEYLHIKGSGSEELPIIIDKYGEGDKPRIDTNGQGIWYQDYGKRLDSSSHKLKGYVSSSILLYDVEYINIRNLEITNNSLEIDKNEAETGISRYNDIKIENCIVSDVNRWGIAVGYTAYWDKFLTSSISDEIVAKYGSTGVEIRNNYVKNAGGDAITTMYCDRPIIEYNVSDAVAKQINTKDYSETGSGRVAAAIWPWKCKDAIFQFNEAFDTYYNQDGQAWDADYGDGTIYQYNYSHNNGGGSVMICGAEAVNTIFRYNISENDLSGVINIPGNPKADFYNNTFYIKEGVPFLRPGMTGGVAVMENNIIYNSGAERNEDWTMGNSRVTYSNNLYYNYNNLPADDKAAITGDPKFENPGSGPKRHTGVTPSSDKNITHDLSAFDGYKLKKNSPAINAGKFIVNNGGRDFFNNVVSGTPDIGAYESDIASLELYSSVYKINNVESTISSIEKNILVKDFLKNLSYDKNVTVVIENILGEKLVENDILTGGSKITLSANGEKKTYTIAANTDNSIKDSIYMIKENGKLLYVPSMEKNPTTVQELINGLTVHSTATIKIFNGDKEITQGNIIDGMTLKVIAENQTENSYTIKVKNNYQWTLDYTGRQGNVWFAQKKANGQYINLTSYDSTYPQWNGNNYAGVGIDAPNHSTVPTEATHGLLVDTVGTSGREQGHAMVYRAPKSGTIILSVKDNEPYLRQAGNTGGKVKLSFTNNGEEISSYELTESLAKINVLPMTITVEKGDFIRIEAQNVENPTKPSIHITPIINYQDVEVDDTEAPTVPTEIKVNNITENTAEISWIASNDNVGVVGYEIYNGDTLLLSINDGTTANVTGLIAGTEYTLSVKAVDASGNKSEARTITFTTTEAIKEVDKTKLTSLVAIMNALDSSKYTVLTWNSLQIELEKANSILVDENAIEEIVKETYEKLNTAYNNLKFILVVDDSIKENVKVDIEEIKAGEENVIDIQLSENPNSIEFSINDVNGLSEEKGSISFNVKDFAKVKIPFEAFKDQVSEEDDKVIFKLNVIKDIDILKQVKAVNKVFEFNIVAVKGNEERKISQFGDGLVEVKLMLTDADLEGINRENLVVLYYNEETKKFEFVETTVNENEVIFKTSHFSKFVVAEKEAIEIVNKDKLIKLVEDIKKLPSKGYSPSTWSKLIEVLENADQVIGENNATKEKVEEAYNKLMKAYLDLRLIPDKAKLQELINKAETIDTDKYTEASVINFKLKLANVKVVLNNVDATQEEVNKAEEELNTTIKDLVVDKVNNDNGNNNSGSNNGNSNNDKLSEKGLLPATGGINSISIATLSIISIILGSVLLKKKR